MDIVPDKISPVELREEVNSRTHRAGYTTRQGGQIPLKIMSRGIGESKLNVWPRDKDGNLIGE